MTLVNERLPLSGCSNAFVQFSVWSDSPIANGVKSYTPSSRILTPVFLSDGSISVAALRTQQCFAKQTYYKNGNVRQNTERCFNNVT